MATKPTQKQNQAWAKKHPGWKQKTQARWAANHPQPLFPSVDVTGKERSGLLSSARQQVTRTYNAVPMPTMQSYLQPFADAHARTQAAGQNYVNYLDSAASNAQNISGAFNSAMTGGINTGQQMVSQQGGGAVGAGIPAAAASLIPAASVGSSFVNYLNAEKPYVGAAVNETERQLNSQQAQATGDYRTAQAQRRQETLDAIQKLYAGNLDTLQGSKVAANKAAVTEYLALGKTAYQKSQNADRRRKTAATISQGQQKINVSKAKLRVDTAYKQATLDQKKTAAAAKGIDLGPAYSQLFVSTPGTSAPGKGTGPAGQRGRWYTITHVDKTASGIPIEGKAVRRFVAYGETVPTPSATQRVTKGDYEYPKGTSSAATRKATPQSWDRAVNLLRNKYPGRITATWLNARDKNGNYLNFPPRPKGT